MIVFDTVFAKNLYNPNVHSMVASDIFIVKIPPERINFAKFYFC